MIQREIGEDAICVLTFDRPESAANIFDAATIRELDEHLDFIEEQNSLQGLVIASAKKSIFIAGADLKTLLRKAQTGGMREFIAEGQRVFNRLASLKIPTCAAIHGACAGGGCEVTLACDWRVASDDPATRIGLPETTLGLIPAWGGSTRLPRLIGAQKAAEVIVKGKLYSAGEALQLGLVDDLFAREELLAGAKRKLRGGKRPAVSDSGRATEQIPTPVSAGNSAPARAIEVITKGLRGSIAESLRFELDAIAQLGETESTRNLIRNFFLAEKYKRGSSKDRTEKIAHAAVIGAGVMGSGITQWLSSRGVSVILRDISSELLTQGLANIDRLYAEAVERGIMPEDKAKEGRARIVASADPGPMRDVQVVIEAASEKLEIKKQIFRDLCSKAPHAVVLATNTSALPITELAAETETPGRVIGLHFFNPVSRMKLVEVVVGTETADETIECALAFTRQIAKTPVVVRDSPGFLVNRVLFPYLLDAAGLFENGVDAEEIDRAILEWGMPMGPLRLIDEIGVDVSVDIADTLRRAYGRRDEAPPILRRMLGDKLLGRKSGGGFYAYSGRERKTSHRSADKARAGELVNRLIFLMVNEAARCLEERVVASPEDADYGMILGTGFPTYRGGPLRFAEHFGIRKIVEKLEGLSQEDNKFAAAEILKKHARDGTRFYES
jgi:3-hydroxyacyl-CoA dehydrogenase